MGRAAARIVRMFALITALRPAFFLKWALIMLDGPFCLAIGTPRIATET